MRTLIGNVRYAVRRLRLSPVFTTAAMLTLALGIGGTTAIFTLVDAVMLRSLPVSDPARLFRIGEGDNCCVQGGLQVFWGCIPTPSISASATPRRSSRRWRHFKRAAGASGCGARRGSRQPGLCARSTSPGTTFPRSECHPSPDGYSQLPMTWRELHL